MPVITISPEVVEAHQRCTVARAQGYGRIFGAKPTVVYMFHQLKGNQDDGPFLIDVFGYPLQVEGMGKPVLAVVTNGMSDQAMTLDQKRPNRPRRRELIQYLTDCPLPNARGLRDMAWLPLFDGFLLDTRDTVTWELPAPSDSPLKHSFFLDPVWEAHQQPFANIGGEPVSFLWRIPISTAELAFKKERGADALLGRMDEVKLPWIFEETNRPPLLKG